MHVREIRLEKVVKFFTTIIVPIRCVLIRQNTVSSSLNNFGFLIDNGKQHIFDQIS
jgi:hypothetical protein